MKSISFHLCCSHEVPMHRVGVNLLAATHNITHLPFGTAILNGNFRVDVVFIALDVDILGEPSASCEQKSLLHSSNYKPP